MPAAAIGLVIGGGPVHLLGAPEGGLPGSRPQLINDLPLIFGLLVFGYGTYTLARTAGDLLWPRTRSSWSPSPRQVLLRRVQERRVQPGPIRL